VKELPQVRILRVLLGAAAFGWGVGFLGIVLPWSVVKPALLSMGAAEIPDDAMLVYWSRMTACTFGFVGVFFLMLALRPHGHRRMLIFAGVMMVCLGAILLVDGLRLKLRAFPFWGDVSFCLVVGAGILYLQQFTRSRPETDRA